MSKKLCMCVCVEEGRVVAIITDWYSPAGHWQVPLTQTEQFFKVHSSILSSQCSPVKPGRHVHM